MPNEGVKLQIFESYPARTVLAANGLSLVIYLLGAALVWGIGLWAALLYLGLCLFLEIRLLATHCVDCHYHGKTCFCGKGRISAMLFKAGDRNGFLNKTFQLRDFLPDLAVGLLPIAAGAFLLVRNFQWGILLMMAGMLAAAFPATGMLRNGLACSHCAQREDCPAAKFFNKTPAA